MRVSFTCKNNENKQIEAVFWQTAKKSTFVKTPNDLNCFLSLVAKDVLDCCDKELSKILFILPNRRACGRFSEELSKQISKSFWAPEISSVNDWIEKNSDNNSAGELESIVALYQAVRKYWKSAGSLSEFSSWGDMLLRDFDELDKYLVDPKKLFFQLSDEKELESRFSILDKDEIRQFARFWKGIKEKPSILQNDWLGLWNKMVDIYTEYHTILGNRQSASAGMIYRSLAEKVSADDDFFKNYSGLCFIGFNALTKVEELIFTVAKERKIGRYYWDLDGHLPEYIKRFPSPSSFQNALNDNVTRFNKISSGDYKKIKSFSFESSLGQIKAVDSWLEEWESEVIDKAKPDCAIVLGEEGMLDELLWGLNLKKHQVNISIGKSIQQTVLGRVFIKLIEELDIAFKEHKDFVRLPHNILSVLTEHKVLSLENVDSEVEDINFLELSSWQWLLQNMKSDRAHSSLYTSREEMDCLELLDGLVEEIQDVSDNYNLTITPDIWIWFLKRKLISSKLAFPGVSGARIHITGILETRVLDYDNLILLSVNEGIWPAGKQSTSFIPYHLRKEFALPVIETLDKMYGYHFFRLLQRAKNVNLAHVSVSDKIMAGVGEKSRFLLQLEHEKKSPIQHIKVVGEAGFSSGDIPHIKKKGKILQKLNKYLLVDDKAVMLSPSAINTFIDCQLRFVYQNLLKIRDEDEKYDLSEPRLFGKILHETMDWIYTKVFIGGMISKEDIKKFMNTPGSYEDTIVKAMQEDVNNSFEKIDVSALTAKDRLVIKVIENYIELILKTDCEYAPFEISGSETRVSRDLQISMNGELQKIRLGGIIDRLDRKGSLTRVIDYKSGRPELKFREFNDLIDSAKSDKRPKEIFQALIYCYLQAGKSSDDHDIQPGLYAMRNLKDGLLQPELFFNGEILRKQGEYLEQTEQLLKTVLEELFCLEHDFKPTDHIKNCEYCNFNRLCQRI